MKSLIIIAALLAVSQITANAEKGGNDSTRIDRNINIEKDYIPEVQPVMRRNMNIITQEPNIIKPNISYSSYASNVQPQSNFYPIEAQTQNIINRGNFNKGYTEISLGYPINWNLEFYCPVFANRSNNIDIHVDHWGISKGKKDFQLVNTDFDMTFLHKMNSCSQFYATIEYGNDYYNYYGLKPDTIEMQSIHNAEANFGLRSFKDINGWDYNVRLGYEFMYLQYYKNHEHSINLDGFMKKTIGHNPLNIGLIFNFNYMNMQKEMNGTAGIMPSYSIIWNGLDFKIGAKVYFAIKHGNIVNAMPDVKISYTSGNVFNIYGGVTGDYKINTLSSILNECRYFDYTSTGLTLNQYTPADFFAGFKIKPFSGFLIDIHANYKFIMHDYFLRNQFNGETISNIITADYANMQHLNAGVRLNYNHKDKYVVHAAMQYNYYNVKSDSIKAWNRPKWEFEIGTEMNPIKGLFLTADFYMGTDYFTPIDKELTNLKELKNHYNLNIGAGYTFKKQYTVFADLNNLLGFGKLIYQDWYGYDNVGFNFKAGIKINF